MLPVAELVDDAIEALVDLPRHDLGAQDLTRVYTQRHGSNPLLTLRTGLNETTGQGFPVHRREAGWGGQRALSARRMLVPHGSSGPLLKTEVVPFAGTIPTGSRFCRTSGTRRGSPIQGCRTKPSTPPGRLSFCRDGAVVVRPPALAICNV